MNAVTGKTAFLVSKSGFISLCILSCQSTSTKPITTDTIAKGTVVDTNQVKTEQALTDKGKKIIYLTFDDGPNKGSKNVMDIIEQEQVLATAFIIGEQVYGSPSQRSNFERLSRIKYYEIANHSHTHAFHNNYKYFYTKPDSAYKDFVRCADSLHLKSGIIRMPGRNIWRTKTVNSTDLKASAKAADLFYSKGFNIIGWDVQWDYNRQLKLTNTTENIIEQIKNMFANNKTKIPGHLVLLAHDQVYEDAQDSGELRLLIDRLKASHEYEFRQISSYPDVKN